ncbi:MAG: NAD kinase [Anaeroplasmataceae bacterium]|nr:NAD kinase [Anaeroplasmataceae bacterium]
MNYWIIHKDDAISLEIKEILLKKIELNLDDKEPELVIVIGGDGTFISAVHQYPHAIFFGIHTGHLGFFANYTLKDIDQLIVDINKSTYQVEKIDILDCTLTTTEKSILAFAMNEMTIITPPKTLIVDVEIDGKRLETFRGTGLCISTAYGSTAYNKSLHGAVLDPKLKAFQIAEIAGINSNQFRTLSSPLLLSSNRKITLKTKQPEEVFVTIDHLSYQFCQFESAQICLLQEKVSIAHSKENNFIERIRRTFLTD